MSLALEDLAANTTPLRVDVTGKGNFLNVVARPMAITAELTARINNATDENEVLAIVVDVVESWDLIAGGQPVPLTVEALRPVPSMVIAAVLKAIGKVGDDSGEAASNSHAG